MALQDEFNKGRRSVRRSRPSRGRRFVDPRTQPRMERQPPMQRRMPPPDMVGRASPRPVVNNPVTAPSARYTALQNQFQEKLRNDSLYQDYQRQMLNLNNQRNQQIKQLLVNAGLPPIGQEISSEQLAAQRRIVMQYNQSPQSAQIGEQIMTMGNQLKTYMDSTYASDIAELREMQPRLGRPTQGVGGLQATFLGLPVQSGFGGIGTGQPVSTSIGNSMFNQDANYVIKGDSLYKDGKFLGSIDGGMMGGGRAGQNRIVMGNDAVVDVPDWVFKTAERQEPDPVVTTPSTSTVSPKGPLYDIMTGGLGSSKPKGGIIPRPKPAVNPGMDTSKKPPRKKPTGTPKAPVKTKPVGGTKPRPKPIERGQESTGPAVKGVMAPKPVRNVDPKTTTPKKRKLRTSPKPEVNVGRAPTRPTRRTPSTRGPNNRPRPSVRQGLSTPRTKPPSTNSNPRNQMGMSKGGMAVKNNFGSNDFRTTGTTISVVDNRKNK